MAGLYTIIHRYTEERNTVTHRRAEHCYTPRSGKTVHTEERKTVHTEERKRVLHTEERERVLHTEEHERVVHT